MKNIWSIALILGCVLPYSPAQTSLQKRPEPVADYIFGSGDQIVLYVTDMEEISDKPVTVDPNGFIDLPLAGRIRIAGLTSAQLKMELVSHISKYIDNPQIAINVTHSGNQPVSVIGEVNTPGVQQLQGLRRLLDAISLAGGLKNDAGPVVIVTRESRWGRIEAPHAELESTRNGYSKATFPLDSLMSSKFPEDNIVLQPHDVISIPRADLVYVVGDVHKAGGFQLSTHRTVSLLQAVSLAEGLGPDCAPHNARILRPSPGGDGSPQQIPVDVKKIFDGKAPDVQLYANDVLFIPHSGVKVTSRRALEAAIGITTGILIYR